MEHERINGIPSRPVAGSATNRSFGNKLIIIAVLAIVLGAGGFVAGMQYQKVKLYHLGCRPKAKLQARTGLGADRVDRR